MTEAADRTEFEVLTLFPALVEGFVAQGLLGKAIEQDRVRIHCTDPRTFTTDRHRTVDDAPFGGGAGMVMKIEPVVAALESVEAARGRSHRVLLSPSGQRFDQRVARRLATLPRITLMCGRYEGIDDRVREHFTDEVLSIGDFVLNGGEVAALTIIEAVSRLREGVLGNPDSIADESFGEDPVLEYPQYTRPASFRGLDVPPVLMGGDHAAIAAWRRTQSLERTWTLRPDLRPRVELDAQVPLLVAVAAPAKPETLGPVARTAAAHGAEGLAVLGDSDPIALAAHAPAGAPPALFATGAQMIKRLRRRHGVAPWVLSVGPEATASDGGPGDLRNRVQPVLEAYREAGSGPAKAAKARPLVLALGEALADRADAALTVPLESDPTDPEAPAQALARVLAILRPGDGSETGA